MLRVHITNIIPKSSIEDKSRSAALLTCISYLLFSCDQVLGKLWLSII